MARSGCHNVFGRANMAKTKSRRKLFCYGLGLLTITMIAPLDRSGAKWDHVAQASRLPVHGAVPARMPGASMHSVVCRPQRALASHPQASQKIQVNLSLQKRHAGPGSAAAANGP